jgi:hypothetical protein
MMVWFGDALLTCVIGGLEAITAAVVGPSERDEWLTEFARPALAEWRLNEGSC